MNGDQINRVGKDVHRITAASGMTVSEAAEMFLRLAGSMALAAHGNDREKGAAQLEQWAAATVAFMRDPATKIHKPQQKLKVVR